MHCVYRSLLLMLPTVAMATPAPEVPGDTPLEVRDDGPVAVPRAVSLAGGLAVGVGMAGVFGRDTVRERAVQCPAPAPVAESSLPPGWTDALWQVGSNGEQIARNRIDIDLLRHGVQGVSADLGDVVRFDKDATVYLRGARLVALGSGDVSADSRQAINGAQLFATEKRVAALEYMQRYAKVGSDELSQPAHAGFLATAMGTDTRAPANGATAYGAYASALAHNSVALGRAAIVLEGAADGFALGSRSRVLAENGMAIGASTQVWAGAHDSVAIGFGSVVQRPFELSVGGQGIRRRITNVMPGIAADDVVSLRQLADLAGVLGTGINAEGGVRALRFAVQGKWYTTVAGALDALDYAVSAGHRAVGDPGDAADAQVASEQNEAGVVDLQGTPSVAAAGTGPAVRAPARQADAPPLPVDVRAVEDAVQRANAYTDQAVAGIDRRFDRLDRRMNRMVAMGSAQAAMAVNTAGLPTWNRLGAGVGHADGESALAVGYQRVLERRATTSFSLNGAFSQGGESTVAVGVGIGW